MMDDFTQDEGYNPPFANSSLGFTGAYREYYDKGFLDARNGVPYCDPFAPSGHERDVSYTDQLNYYYYSGYHAVDRGVRIKETINVISGSDEDEIFRVKTFVQELSKVQEKYIDELINDIYNKNYSISKEKLGEYLFDYIFNWTIDEIEDFTTYLKRFEA